MTSYSLRYKHIPITINSKIIPHSNTAKYLEVTLDAKLHWKAHVKKKREEIGLKYKKMYWLMGRRSALSVQSNLMLYKQILKPVRTTTYSWLCTKQTNADIIQRFQNKILRNIDDAPWYIRNADLHRDLPDGDRYEWNWGGSLRSMKKGFFTTSMSKGSSCSTIVNWCEDLKKNFWAGVVITKSRAEWIAPWTLSGTVSVQ